MAAVFPIESWGNKCPIAKECLTPSDKCSGIGITIEDKYRSAAEKHGLPLGSDPDGYNRRRGLITIELCQRTIGSENITQGVRLLLAEAAPEAFIDAEDRQALQEVDAVLSGSLTDIGEVTTDLGMEAVDLATSEAHRSFHPVDHRLTEQDGSLALVPIYDLGN